jgi:glutamate 5-kinase
MMNIRNMITNANTIVIKVGTTTITHSNGSLNLMVVEELVRVLSDLRNQEKNIVLVTSGAIGVGRAKMGFHRRPDTIPEKQALAAIGQVSLMHYYSKLFNEYGQVTSQILLTKDVIDIEERKINTYNTFKTLFSFGSIPIVNENDTVATEEIVYGDNDTLSAVVAVLIKADLLIILSDIDGLYDKNPKLHEDARLIHAVHGITDEICSNCEDTNSDFGTGGMKTKISAAKICHASGIPLVIANGDDPKNICRILQGKDIGTLFIP